MENPRTDLELVPAETASKPAPHSAWALRRELEKAVVKELLGPAAGPEEEVDEPTIRDRYLVGMLAAENQQVELEEQDRLEVDAAGAPEEGPAEPSAPQAPTMLPSSFGLSFTVAGETPALRVTARWGWYQKVPSENVLTPTGKAKKVWKRTPVEGVRARWPLREGWLDPWSPSETQPEVRVKGFARKNEGDWVVSVFLLNGQQEPEKSKDQAWLFQPELIVEGPGRDGIFRRRFSPRDGLQLDPATRAEKQDMALLYRHHLEFATGHGVAVAVERAPEDPERAVRVATSVLPAHEIPRQTPPSAHDNPDLAGLVLDMKALAETPGPELQARLAALPEAYALWIDRQRQLVLTEASGLGEHAAAAQAALQGCARALERIREGLALLGANETAAEAFRFMNRAMHLQRVHSLVAEARRRGQNVELADLDEPANRTWYPFQLGFILMCLPSCTDLHHPERSDPEQALADLLWFPTGGGKSEAYLGLTAYVLGLRRLQGPVEGRSGEHGVAVLMRYTLRLLTLQQFQRASALMCACEALRREAAGQGDTRWGREPFRLGLWVGQRTTPNKTDRSDEATKQDHGQFQQGGIGGSGSPHQLTNCPWCGTPIDPGVHIKVHKYPNREARTFVYCGDALGRCLYSERNSPNEGLPVLVVDEEIYRRLPALLIATVDKFAQLPWQGATQMLFGQVQARCSRHGFRSPAVDDADSHPKSGSMPAAHSQEHAPLRPPDLIVQDELHLISGPLGTLVGLYETAVDELSAWEVGGRRVLPKVIASTATVRRAAEQVEAIFTRRLAVFPPQGLDVRDNFFSLQRPPSEQHPGRLYLGICAPGKRLKAALIRVYVAFLAASQKLFEEHGAAADPWMTLVGYFGAMRELGGMRRLVEDDIRSRLREMGERGLARRGPPVVEELTSRKSSTDIPRILDLLETPFEPAAEGKKPGKPGRPRPLDVLLATNMLSVGVDVKRLGLMAVAGQPKTTAEYIQATSRVGRHALAPGIVCTVYNWARPRDLSHYERFEHYHATFYQHVEALSVTPFSRRALDRGLTAVLVSMIRLSGAAFNDNAGAGRLDPGHPFVQRAVDAIAARAERVTGSSEIREEVLRMLQERLAAWLAKAGLASGGAKLGYREHKDGLTLGLLQPPGLGAWDDFTCLNSLRDVEPTVGLILQEHGLDGTPPPLHR